MSEVRRRLEQYIANPRCESNARSVVTAIPMAEVARALAVTPKFGQSPFAIARGVTFEKSLFSDSAAKLRTALIARGALPPDASGFLDLRLSKVGGTAPTLEDSAAQFKSLVESFATTPGPDYPVIIAGPVVPAPIATAPLAGWLAIDALTVHRPSRGGTVLRVGEIKVYPDRGGYTDRSELASARAQAGLYVWALRKALQQWQITTVTVANSGFLVLAWGGTNVPSVRADEDLRFQAERAEESCKELEAFQQSLAATTGAALDEVKNAPHWYDENCLSFCELADYCQKIARSTGDGVALGRDIGRLLGSIRLARAVELLDGARPNTDEEIQLLRRMGYPVLGYEIWSTNSTNPQP